ncbi:MAG TPA: hypothetical protein VMH83_09220 [Candidatus Acidoferrum sp.]|nr:hypothetical protein [Candidatus Acidoferrum sp.]
MADLDKLIKQHLQRKELLPGVASGRYEQRPQVDKAELRTPGIEDNARRDNRINIRISGKDLTELQKLALAEGIPTQSLIANIIHHYVQGTLVDVSRSNLHQAADLKKEEPVLPTKSSTPAKE